MLRLIKRHTEECNTAYQKKYAKQISAPDSTRKKPKNKAEGDFKCRHPCKFVVVGPNPIYDPTSTDPRKQSQRIKMTLETDSHQLALQKLRDIEHDLLLNTDQKPKAVTLADAVRDYLNSKAGKSRERRVKNARVVFRRQVLFLAARYGLIDEATRAELDVKAKTAEEEQQRDAKLYQIAGLIPITRPTSLDVDAFILSFNDMISTKKDCRALVKSFWFWVSVKALRPDNIAAKAAAVATSREERVEKNKRHPTFTHDEYVAFLQLLHDPQRCAAVLKKENDQDPEASEKTRYLALLQVESAMALGDCVSFRGDDMREPMPNKPSETPIVHERLKTGQLARPFIPLVLAQNIRTKFKWDSPTYPFWSGEGDPENRGKTYRFRLKKLFIAAGIRVHSTSKRKKISGVTQPDQVKMLDSDADPHYWRHTWVRDAYIADEHPRDIASWLGDNVAAVEKYYSCFDDLRHKQLADTAGNVRSVRPRLDRASVA